MSLLARKTVVECVRACRIHGAPVRSAFLIGSLARGGFSRRVSDLDLVLVLERESAHAVGAIDAGIQACRAANSYMADRLSVFYAEPDTLRSLPALQAIAADSTPSSGVSTSRFPLYDRLDLIEHGVVLDGDPRKDFITRPPPTHLNLESAVYALRRLRAKFPLHHMADPEWLRECDVRTLSKVVMFPARVVCMISTAQLAHNDRTAAFFRGSTQEALVRAAYDLRSESEEETHECGGMKTSSCQDAAARDANGNEERRLRVEGECARHLLPLWSECVVKCRDFLKVDYPDEQLLAGFEQWAAELELAQKQRAGF